jgi:hypothetical protein
MIYLKRSIDASICSIIKEVRSMWTIFQVHTVPCTMHIRSPYQWRFVVSGKWESSPVYSVWFNWTYVLERLSTWILLLWWCYKYLRREPVTAPFPGMKLGVVWDRCEWVTEKRGQSIFGLCVGGVYAFRGTQFPAFGLRLSTWILLLWWCYKYLRRWTVSSRS